MIELGNVIFKKTRFKTLRFQSDLSLVATIIKNMIYVRVRKQNCNKYLDSKVWAQKCGKPPLITPRGYDDYYYYLNVVVKSGIAFILLCFLLLMLVLFMRKNYVAVAGLIIYRLLFVLNGADFVCTHAAIVPGVGPFSSKLITSTMVSLPPGGGGVQAARGYRYWGGG